MKGEQIYRDACEELSLINQAALRDDKENMSFLMCQSLKECMFNMMRCYLIMKKGEPACSESLAGLVSQCAGINRRFKKIDLRRMSCKYYDFGSEGDMFCSTMQRVQHCVLIANGIKKLIDDDMRKSGNGG